MDAAFVEKMEASLLKLRNEIIDNLSKSGDSFREVVDALSPKDDVDKASDDIDRKMIAALGSQEVKRFKLIDNALIRIKQGKYGSCLKCGKPIPQDRLEAIPYALQCLPCKADEEKRNR
jgi:RNA polymerase-binding protein DksA